MPPSLLLFSWSLSYLAKVLYLLPQPCLQGHALLCYLICLLCLVPDKINCLVWYAAGPGVLPNTDYAFRVWSPCSSTKTLPSWTLKHLAMNIREQFLKISSLSISSFVLRTRTCHDADHLTNIFISLAVRVKTLQNLSGLRSSSAAEESSSVLGGM